MIELKINGEVVPIATEPDTPLLWVIREQAGLTGTKFGCGVGQCGACTVHLNGMAIRSCVMPAMVGVGAEVTTIEGLDHAVRQAWIDEQVPQCGYCQSGQLMAAAALLEQNPAPTDDEVAAAMTNLCRCGTYEVVRRGIRRASAVVVAQRAAAEAAAEAERAAAEAEAAATESGADEGVNP